MTDKSENLIGIFDSGVGGLSIMREIQRIAPNESILYFADSGFCPYGTKPVEVVQKRVFDIADFLISQGSKLLVLACNTAGVSALKPLRERIAVPVVGVEPAVKPAAAVSRNGKIGVLATPGTLVGESYHSLLVRFGSNINTISVACPKLVPLVEEGIIEGSEVEAALNEYLEPILSEGADTIVLGCTHYAFLKPTIQRLIPSHILIIDTGEPVAKHTIKTLTALELTRRQDSASSTRYYTSGTTEKMRHALAKLLNITDADITTALQH